MGELKFQKLTPTQEADLSGYEDAFHYIFAEDDIRNIAISGAYSSGKSSVIESYKKKHPDKKFLHLSLAHFQALDDGSLEENDSEDNTKMTAQEAMYEELPAPKKKSDFFPSAMYSAPSSLLTLSSGLVFITRNVLVSVGYLSTNGITTLSNKIRPLPGSELVT